MAFGQDLGWRAVSTYIERCAEPALSPSGESPLLVAVKDIIDVAGVPTTLGCAAIARRARPAASDAGCLVGFREAGAVITGKTNLHELAHGATGENAFFGTPTNPLDAERIPGGSSSGSAVAVATGDVEVAIGTDTGGSIRIPAACCGVVGLKTTFGRISLEGVWPLAPSLDTVGPLGRDVAAVARGFALLDSAHSRKASDRGGTEEERVAPEPRPSRPEPGAERVLAGRFGSSEPGAERPSRVGRLRGIGPVDPAIDEAIDAALAAAELEVIDVVLPGFATAVADRRTVLLAEAYAVDGFLIRDTEQFSDDHEGTNRHERGERGSPRDGGGGEDEPAGRASSDRADALERRAIRPYTADLGVGRDTYDRLLAGAQVTEGELAAARRRGRSFRASLAGLIAEIGVLALPTLDCAPPLLGHADSVALVRLVSPFNLAGLPALCLPVPVRGDHAAEGSRRQRIPASLQLVGSALGEWDLLRLGALVEEAVGPLGL